MRSGPGWKGVICLCAMVVAPAAFGEGLEQALEAIDGRCADRAAEEVAAEWPEIERGAEERGLEVTQRHRAAHERVLQRRCAVSDRIELVEGIREDLSEDEWEDFGGDELLRDLRDEIQALQAY
ncbi:hypothetical protein [Aquisalimonas asiatica]|uniref:Uncharacterized protein n=1 Tax=Aquisalimonas asiatica TaxID=406100 RepID=A0A1H8TZR9_9GAMM|nr:hypothetical protein [Aquisalimonas asiatica]SEO96421.1 hypothetical protein SAMN04488052_10564 [Aquisalimonas asiatica]